MLPLSARQAAVLAFIRDHCAQNGFPPTHREIGRRFEIASPNGVKCHLEALEKKGYLKRDPQKSRGIHLVASDRKCCAVCQQEFV